jgi:hypothetical protein
MKIIKKVFFLFLYALMFLGCQRHRVPEGEYSFEWTIVTEDNITFNSCPSNNVYMSVLESNKAYILLSNSDTLYRDGKHVLGTFKERGGLSCHGNNRFFGDMHLTGTIRKENGIHYISGEITTIVYGPKEINNEIIWDTVSAVGTFEMKSVF